MALTSLVVKCSEKLFKREIMQRTQRSLDPLEFAYRVKGGEEDAVVTLSHLVLQHLDKPKTSAFASAFNTIQQHIFTTEFGLDFNLVRWILNFLVKCYYLACTQMIVGVVLEISILKKFADDSVIVSLLSEEDSTHGPVDDDFIAWCQKAFLKLMFLEWVLRVLNRTNIWVRSWIINCPFLQIQRFCARGGSKDCIVSEN